MGHSQVLGCGQITGPPEWPTSPLRQAALQVSGICDPTRISLIIGDGGPTCASIIEGGRIPTSASLVVGACAHTHTSCTTNGAHAHGPVLPTKSPPFPPPLLWAANPERLGTLL